MTDIQFIKKIGYKNIFNVIYKDYYKKNVSVDKVTDCDFFFFKAYSDLINKNPQSADCLASTINSKSSSEAREATRVFLELTGVNPHDLL